MTTLLSKNLQSFLLAILLFLNVHLIPSGNEGGNLYAQNTTLLDNSWFIHAARDSNISNGVWNDYLNLNPELKFEIIFMNDKIFVQGCCGGSFEMNVNYNGNNEMVILQVTELETSSCNENFVSTFYQRIKGAFEGMIGETLSFIIQQYDNGFGLALTSFTLSHPSNNSFVNISNIPNEMEEQSHAPFSGNDPPNHNWSLTQVEFQGEELELPYGAAITNFTIYDGTIEIALCGSINGFINFSWILDVEEFSGQWFINNCGALTNTIQNCEVVPGVETAYLENFKLKTFNFLNESQNQYAEWEFNFGENILTDSYTLTLTDVSQNKLIFHSNENYLNTTNFDLGLGIAVFPNPVAETLFIKQKEITREITAFVYSINGKLLHTQNLDATLIEIDVTELNSGVYFVTIKNNSGQLKTQKLIKI